MKQDVQEKGNHTAAPLQINISIEHVAGELKEAAVEKVEEAKDKAGEVIADAKEKGQGMNGLCGATKSITISFSEVKQDAEQKGSPPPLQKRSHTQTRHF